MAVFKRGTTWWYEFIFEGRRIQESAKTSRKTAAKRAEEDRRRELREGVVGVDRPKDRVRSIKTVSDEYLTEYKLKHRNFRFLIPTKAHLCQHLGDRIIGQINVRSVSEYQTARLKEGASGRTVNMEVGVLLRMIGNRGDLVRGELKHKRTLKLKENENVGKKYNILEQDRLLDAAKESSSPHVHFALRLALNGGMRDIEIKTLRWSQIDFAKNLLTVGESKTKESSGRFVPLNGEILPAFLKHREWYVKAFGELKPNWYVFPFGRPFEMDPTKHVTTLKTAWRSVKAKAGVKGRWHDTRHTVVSQLQENGESAETTMAIVGHVSTSMLKRYSHIGTEAKRRALEDMITYRNAMRAKEEQAESHLSSHKATVN